MRDSVLFFQSVCLFLFEAKSPYLNLLSPDTHIFSQVYTHTITQSTLSLSFVRAINIFVFPSLSLSLSLSLIQNHSLTAKVVFYSLSLTLILASVSEIVIFSLVVDVVVDIVALSSGVPSLQCDQIGRFIGLWATF